MASLSELTVQVVTARLAKKEMSLEELQQEMTAVSAMIRAIDEGSVRESSPAVPAAEGGIGRINFKKVFKDDEVVCLVCNRSFTTLKRHLAAAHQLSPLQYRKRFDIPPSQPLVARSYSEERSRTAQKRGMGAVLAKARQSKATAKREAIQESSKVTRIGKKSRLQA